ncbi:unnamed protein product [Somion occarium]|uniref:Protein-S-isoprenylcysteine O-methyltransferase n=1 Tax=Somion occarium TaxID=3059160 RepID=A0ABP1E1B5_9APHY
MPTRDPSFIVRLPLLPILAFAVHKVMFPPNPPPTPNERLKFEVNKKTRDIIPSAASWLPQSIGVVSHVVSLCEVYVLLCKLLPSANYTPLSSLHIRLSATFGLGFLLACLGFGLRMVCYQKLGRHFTFELAVRKKHTLITDGPYAWMRHPAYAGALVHVAGMLLCQFGPGSWWYEGGLWQTIGGKLLSSVMFSLVATLVAWLGTRMQKEDVVLKEQFGAQWGRWAKKTPDMIIPYVY